MATVLFLPRAEKDLLELPDKLQDEILNKAAMLADFPHMGPAMERAFRGYRCLLAGNNRYRIVYKVVSAKRVEIAYIRHCRRQMRLRLIH